MDISAISLANISLIFFVAALLLLTPLPSVSAQSGEPVEADQVADIIAGPHAVKVVLINSNLAAGFIHMGFLVTDASTGEAVSDARVVIKAINDKEEYEGITEDYIVTDVVARNDGTLQYIKKRIIVKIGLIVGQEKLN